MLRDRLSRPVPEVVHSDDAYLAQFDRKAITARLARLLTRSSATARDRPMKLSRRSGTGPRPRPRAPSGPTARRVGHPAARDRRGARLDGHVPFILAAHSGFRASPPMWCAPQDNPSWGGPAGDAVDALSQHELGPVARQGKPMNVLRSPSMMGLVSEVFRRSEASVAASASPIPLLAWGVMRRPSSRATAPMERSFGEARRLRACWPGMP